ncbi:hypothetical protein [Halarsenatibacter silvermanii]|uniref:Uncharacterized protein n=1 Tax=Halarsenatibacter silvermanii TaxID=321763 RepID=A0A1G9RCS1_9FIRM|nr:hypothetical protein [Halarsenatibacter silvermanii]SDM21028.1 hypothetical protein SAMN04488692_12140 [Halarsenatibacter silvermanii]
MSKKEVLEDVYPDELEYIFEEMRREECRRYMDYYNQLAAGMVGQTKKDDRTIEKYIEEIIKEIKELSDSPGAPDEKAGPDDPEEIKRKLEEFTSQIGRGRG